jgi:hypothetical protein
MSKRSARRKAARQRQAAAQQTTAQGGQPAVAQGGQPAASSNGQVSKATPTKAPANKGQTGKAQSGKTQPKHKTRGTLLTIALAFILVDAIVGAVLAAAFLQQDNPNTPLLLTAASLVALLGVAAAVGLWFWKKWALLLYIVTVLASIGIGLVVVPSASFYIAFHALIPVLILGAAMSVDKKLPLFE